MNVRYIMIQGFADLYYMYDMHEIKVRSEFTFVAHTASRGLKDIK